MEADLGEVASCYVNSMRRRGRRVYATLAAAHTLFALFVFNGRWFRPA